MSEEAKEMLDQPTPEAELPPAEGEPSGQQPVETPPEEVKPEKQEEPPKEQTIDDLPLPGEEGEQEKDHEKNWPKGFKERLKRQEKHLQQRETENAQLKQQLQNAMQQHQTQVANNQAPKRDDFSSEEEYFDARHKYLREQERLEEQAKAIQTQRAQFLEVIQKRQDDIDAKGLSKYDDYDDVTEVLFKYGFPTNQAMYEAIAESDFAADMFYFLGKHPEEAKKIAVLNPIKAVKQISALEARFKARKNSTQAPRPVTTVKSQPTSALSNDPNKMSPEDYRKWREGQKKR